MRICPLVIVSVLLSACSKQAMPPQPAPQHAAPTAPATTAPARPATTVPQSPQSANQGGETADAFFDPARYPDAIQGTMVDPNTLTASEQQWGISPKPDPRVTYRDGVILMEHGDQAVRGGGTDGITYRFDATADHVGEFAQGKIIFATGRVVGRIAQLQRDGDTVTVKLTPVQITEIIRKGQFLMSAPLDVSQLQVRLAPDFPGVVDSSEEAPAQSFNWDPESAAAVVPVQLGRTPLPSLLGQNLMPPPIDIPQPPPAQTLDLSSALRAGPVIDLKANGVGVGYTYEKKGISVAAAGLLLVGRPTIRFLLSFSDAGIQDFGLDITGSLGIRFGVRAHTDIERMVNAKVLSAPPIDVYIPVPIGGVPLELSFHSSFYLETGFSAKRSELQTQAEYRLNGHLFTGYKNGSKSFDYPTAEPTSRLVENVNGISMGINTLGGTFQVRPQIGIGAFGFSSGLYVALTFAGTGVKQSSAARDCRGADLTGTIASGIGYALNKGIMSLINKLLKAFTDYQLPTEGTLVKGPGGQIFKIDEDIPTNCAGLGAKT